MLPPSELRQALRELRAYKLRLTAAITALERMVEARRGIAHMMPADQLAQLLAVDRRALLQRSQPPIETPIQHVAA